MALVTLRNDFHNTSVTIRCDTLSHIHHTVTIRPSRSQIERARKSLCGISGCECSGCMGTRGRQTHNGKLLEIDFGRLYTN